MKIISLLLSFLLSFTAIAEELSLYVQVNEPNNVIRIETGDVIPVVPANGTVKKSLEELPHGSDVFLKGHIEYLKSSDLGTLRPWFIVDSIKKVSMKDLRPELLPVQEKLPESFPESVVVLRPTFNVTQEVVSSITFTTGFLMLQNMSIHDNADPEGRKQIQQALFLSAGTIATLAFLYEQLRGKSKP